MNHEASTVSVSQANVHDPNKRKPVSEGERKKSQQSSTKQKLPWCPDGATEFVTNQGPCRKKQSKNRRRRTFRVPLKKEDGNLESQIIEYNAEFPNRVVVRLEYLMQSTKVRLNDREWMADFYEKLVEEETRSMRKSIREREKGEMSRMKRLIIEGINKEIPDELAYLHEHPVFRVNQMLQRLAAFDSGLTVKAGDVDDITPVEPYEYDGNRFFRNLHEHGTIWIPVEQQRFEREKLIGKVYRAKLRLKQKREQKAAEDKVLRLLNNPDQADAISLIHEEDITLSKNIIRGGDDTVDLSVGGLVDRLQTKSNMTINRIDEKIRKSKVREMERAKVLETKRRENEKKFVHHAENHAIVSPWSSSSNDTEPDVVDQILKKEREETVGPDDRVMTIRMRMHDHSELARKSRKSAETKETLRNFKGSVFNHLLHAYKVPLQSSFTSFEPHVDGLVRDLESDSDFENTTQAADKLTLMFDRQKLVMEDHLEGRKRNA